MAIICEVNFNNVINIIKCNDNVTIYEEERGNNF